MSGGKGLLSIKKLKQFIKHPVQFWFYHGGYLKMSETVMVEYMCDQTIKNEYRKRLQNAGRIDRRADIKSIK